MVTKKRGKKRIEKMDGLGPFEKKKIRAAVRQVWHRSHARKLAVLRSTDSKGFSRCEQCGKRNPGNKIDHITAVGEVDGGFIARMFCPSKMLQALCKACHDEKTKRERAAARKAAEDEKDFY